MIKFGLIAWLILFIPIAVNAKTYATIINITPNYFVTKTFIKKKSCHIINKPIYRKSSVSGANGGDILTGIILGGLIGKGLTGKDKGAAAGAVLGGVIASDHVNVRTSVIGYRKKRKCRIINVPQRTKRIKNYKIDYEWNGIFGSSYTHNNYSLGQNIPISVKINAN